MDLPLTHPDRYGWRFWRPFLRGDDLPALPGDRIAL
ncbi:hypothetical protein C1Y40_01702 [Mycobacterium talmoniae]|uniref:Uncharacterized protein n=1 Tax=Mycobacterium talmoniae TaxID=1858794 RepID=A0A2S8BN19_9MYCO|nr:hypothetical protein C1Y40_01702 [Mycobacterium talmoniae]